MLKMYSRSVASSLPETQLERLRREVSEQLEVECDAPKLIVVYDQCSHEQRGGLIRHLLVNHDALVYTPVISSSTSFHSVPATRWLVRKKISSFSGLFVLNLHDMHRIPEKFLKDLLLGTLMYHGTSVRLRVKNLVLISSRYFSNRYKLPVYNNITLVDGEKLPDVYGI